MEYNIGVTEGTLDDQQTDTYPQGIQAGETSGAFSYTPPDSSASQSPELPHLPQPSPSFPEPNHKNSRIRLLLVGIAVTCVVIAGVALFLYKPMVSVQSDTPEANITIDQTVYTKPKRVSPGKHTIVVARDGYVPYTFDGAIRAFSSLNLATTLRPLATTQSIVSDNAFAASFGSDGKQLYYFASDKNTLYKLTLTDNPQDSKKVYFTPEKISPDNLVKLNKVVFAPDFSVAIFKRVDGDTGLYDFKRYNLLNQEYTSWGKDIGDAVWNSTDVQDDSRVIYYYAPPTGERLLMKSNRKHDSVTNIMDLKEKAGITVSADSPVAPQLSWSRDNQALLIVTEGKLLAMNVVTQTISYIAQSGVTSAQFAPDSHHIIYTQNGKLVWQRFEVVNGLSGNEEDQKNVGRIKIAPPEPYDVAASATQGIFTADGKKFIVINDTHSIVQIDLVKKFVSPFYLKDDPRLKTVTSLGLSGDGRLLYGLTGSTILAIPLDDGSYTQTQEKK